MLGVSPLFIWSINVEETLEYLDCDDIIIPLERQRRDFEPSDLRSLGESIIETKQIHPILIDPQRVLIAGERRTRAIMLMKEAGKHDGQILCRTIQPVSDFHRHAMELEENIKRVGLSASEESMAVAEYHRLKQQIKGAAVQNKTTETGKSVGHGQKDTAAELGMSQSQISDHLKVSRVLEANPQLAEEAKKGNYSRQAILAKFKQNRIREIRYELAKRASAKMPITLENIVFESSCLDFLDTLKPNSVDAIITDIPFGMNVFESMDLNKSSLGKQWNDDPAHVEDMCMQLLPKMYRCLKEGTHAFIFCSWHQTFYLHKFGQTNGFVYEMPPWIWDRENITPSRNKTLAAGKMYEFCVHLRKGSPAHPEEGFGGDVLRFRRPTNPKYPSEKPLDLMRHMVKIATLPNELVVDPCCGSGSTGVAALLEGRRVLLNDLNPEAVKVAQSRLALECKAQLGTYNG